MTTINRISDDFYDNITHNLLYTRMTEEEFMIVDNDMIDDFLFTRWKTITMGLMPSHYNQYASQTTQESRNNWIQVYLDYPTKDISLMPEIFDLDNTRFDIIKKNFNSRLYNWMKIQFSDFCTSGDGDVNNLLEDLNRVYCLKTQSECNVEPKYINYIYDFYVDDYIKGHEPNPFWAS